MAHNLHLQLLLPLKRLLSCFIAKAETALFIHDDHYALTITQKRYSQLADPFAMDLRSLGFSVQIYRYPGSKLSESALKYKSYNTSLLFSLFCCIGLVATLSKRSAKIYAWSALIRLLGCKYIYAFQPSPNLCQAACHSNVAVYDLQHGMIAPNDPYYQPYFDPWRDQALKPDAILFLYKASFDFWKFRASSPSCQYLGSPYLADPIHQKSMPIHNQAVNYGITILFSQQPGYGRSWGTAEDCDGQWLQAGIPLCLVELLRDLSHPVSLIIRLHPLSTEDADSISDLFVKLGCSCEHKIEIVCGTTVPLPAHLAAINLHVTSHSAVVYEAAECNVPSIVLAQSDSIKQQYQALADQGLVVFASNHSKQFANAVQRIIHSADSTDNQSFRFDPVQYRCSYLHELKLHLNKRHHILPATRMKQ